MLMLARVGQRDPAFLPVKRRHWPHEGGAAVTYRNVLPLLQCGHAAKFPAAVGFMPWGCHPGRRSRLPSRSGGLCALGLQSALTVVDAFSGPGYLSPKQRREQTLRAPLCGCRRAGLMTGLPACLLITLFLVFEIALSKGLRTPARGADGSSFEFRSFAARCSLTVLYGGGPVAFGAHHWPDFRRLFLAHFFKNISGGGPHGTRKIDPRRLRSLS